MNDHKLYNICMCRSIGLSLESFNSLIQGHMKRDGGDPKIGYALFDRLQQPPFNLKPNDRTYNSIVWNLCHEKKWDRIDQYLSTMWTSRSPPTQNTFDIYLTALGKAQNWERVDRTMKSMKTLTPLPKTLVSLIRSAGNGGDIERCKKYFDDMVRFGYTIGDGANAAM
jgi:pentatricopeptide repeat protein